MLNKLCTSLGIILMLTCMTMATVIIGCGEMPLGDNGEIAGDTSANEEDNSSTDIDLTEQEIAYFIERAIETDGAAIALLPNEQQAQIVQIILENDIRPDGISGSSTQDEHAFSSLTGCSGYWPQAANWKYESIEQRDSRNGLKYEVGPNCVMPAPGDDCGTDHDDVMLSFYFGNHAESLDQLCPMLRWTSTSGWVQTLLQALSGRVYEQVNGGGRDNYNIYVCLDDYFNPYLDTFRMRKY